MKKNSLNIIGIIFLILVQTTAWAQWATPDENTAGCVRTPAELAQRADMNHWLNQIQDESNNFGIDALYGTWKFSFLITSAKISFRYDSNGFYVQNDDDPEKQVSLCLDAAGNDWLRVAVHKPACPETKNIYIQAKGLAKIDLKSYAAQKAPGGKARFKKISDEFLPPGFQKPAPKCDM